MSAAATRPSYETPLRVLKPYLETRSLRILWAGGYRTVDQVLKAHDEELTDLPNFGSARLYLTRQAVRDYFAIGVYLAGGDATYPHNTREA